MAGSKDLARWRGRRRGARERDRRSCPSARSATTCARIVIPVKSMSAIATASMMTCWVSGRGQVIVHLATKDAGVGEEQLLVEEHGQDVVDRRRPLRFRLPTGRARARPSSTILGSRRAPGLIEDRQSHGDAEALLDADEDDAEGRDDREQELPRGSMPDLAELVDLDESATDEEQHARQRGQGNHVGELGEGARARARHRRRATNRTNLVRPPASCVTVVRAGLALTGKAPTSPARDVRQPDAHEVPTDVVGDRPGRRRRCDSRGGALAQDHDHQGEGRRADDVPTAHRSASGGATSGVAALTAPSSTARRGSRANRRPRGWSRRRRRERPREAAVDLLADTMTESVPSARAIDHVLT
jgi:hypothetical protein